MSNPNFDTRYATPALVDSKVASQAAPISIGSTVIAWRNGTASVGATVVSFIGMTTIAQNDDTTRYQLNGMGLQVLKAGTYMICWYMDCDSSATGSRTALIQKTGGITLGEVGGYNGGLEFRTSAVRVVRLAANDTIYLNAYFSNAGGTLGAAPKDTGITITLMGN